MFTHKNEITEEEYAELKALEILKNSIDDQIKTVERLTAKVIEEKIDGYVYHASGKLFEYDNLEDWMCVFDIRVVSDE